MIDLPWVALLFAGMALVAGILVCAAMWDVDRAKAEAEYWRLLGLDIDESRNE